MNKMLDEARRLVDEDTERREPDLPEAVSFADGADALLREMEDGFEPFFEFDDEAWHLYWGGFDYDIADNLISSPEKLLGVVSHLSEKRWPLMSVDRLGRFVHMVAHRKGWKIY